MKHISIENKYFNLFISAYIISQWLKQGNILEFYYCVTEKSTVELHVSNFEAIIIIICQLRVRLFLKSIIILESDTRLFFE